VGLRLLTVALGILGFGTVHLRAQFFSGSSDFSDSAGWAVNFSTGGAGLVVNGTLGRLGFGSPSTSGTGGWFWIGTGAAAWENSWTAAVDVTNNIGAAQLTGTPNVTLRSYLEVYFPGRSTPLSRWGLFHSTNASGEYSESARFSNLYNTMGGAEQFIAASVATTVTFRVDFDAINKVLTGFISTDGRVTYVNTGSFDIDTGVNPWDPQPTGLGIGLWSGATNWAVTGNAIEMYFDNFSVTVVPEPSGAGTMAGALTLLICLGVRSRHRRACKPGANRRRVSALTRARCFVDV